MSDELHDALSDLAGQLDAAGIFDEAERSNTARLLADPDWTRPRWVHVHDLVTFFMVGVSEADVWHLGYTLPPGFSDVVNGIAAQVQARWPGEQVVKLSVFDYEQLIREWIALDPQVTAWNETDGPQVVAVSRYSRTPDSRDFIDLGALTRQAANAFRHQSDRHEAFDAKFEAESKAEHPDQGADT